MEDDIIQGELQQETPTNTAPEEKDNPTQAEEPEPQYTPEEIAETGIEALDPTRIPPELIPWYKSMLRDYRSKTEQLAREREELRRKAEPAPAQPQLTPAQINAIKVRQIAEASKIRACREYLGIEVSQFSEFDSDHITAFNLAQREITDAVKAEEAKQQSSSQRKNAMESILSEYRIKEPNFDKIDKWAGEWVDNLPARQHREFFATLASGNSKDIREAIETIRRAWYEKNSKKKGVPALESSTSDAPSKPKRDARAFGNMSEEEQVEYLKNYV